MATNVVRSVESINLDVTEVVNAKVLLDDELIGLQIETSGSYESLKNRTKEFLKELKLLVEVLEENRNAIDENYIGTKKTVLASSAVSAVGGGLIIAGTVGAPATLGASLSLTAVGGALVVGGTAASLCSEYKSSKTRKAFFDECKERARQIDKEGNDLKELHEEYIKHCVNLAEKVRKHYEINPTFQIDSGTLKHIMMALQAGSNSKALTSTIIKAAVVNSSIICKTGHIIGFSGNHVRIHGHHTRHAHHAKHAHHTRHVHKIMIAAKPSISVGSKIVVSVGVALGGIGILVDIVTGIMALHDIMGKTKCSESRVLTHNIEKAKKLVIEVQEYFDLLCKEPHEYFDKAIAGIDEQHIQIEELKEENEQLRAIIGEIEKKHETAIAELKQNLRVEIKEEQSQFLQALKEEQEKQQKQMQKQMQELMQQLTNSQK